jgi:hypothetical protein
VGNRSCKKRHIITGTVTLPVISTARQAREEKGVREGYVIIHTQKKNAGCFEIINLCIYLVLYSYTIFNNTFNYVNRKRIHSSLDD